MHLFFLTKINVQDDKVCLYSYSAEQQFGENETSLTVTVEIMCHSGELQCMIKTSVIMNFISL